MKLLLTSVLKLPNVLIRIIWNKKDMSHMKSSLLTDLRKVHFLVRLLTSATFTGVPSIFIF